jgi:LruC domain-containing protein
MKKIIVLITILSTTLVGFAQTPLAVLNAESGNRALEQANCWGFGAVTYSNLEFRINGFWSMRSNQLTSLLTTSCWIKSPWIKPSSGNITMKVRLENDRGTSRGVVLQYIPYDANAVSNYKEGSATAFYTYNWATPLDIWVKDLTVPVPAAIINSGQPYKILISFIGSGGTSRAFSDDLFIPGTYWSDPSSTYCLPLPVIQDADADGIADANDAYPNDASRAYNIYYPASGKGTIMFEDLWPTTGDYDFNDLVMNFRQLTVLNAQNKVVELKMNTTLKAIGAGFHNGFGFQLDDVNPSKIISVTGTNTHGASWVSTSANGTESGQSFANIIAFDDAFKILPSPGGSGVNVDPANPFATPVDLNITISFNTTAGEAITYSDLRINPYLIVNQERGKEVHLANMRPTDKADRNLFGTGQDDSNIGEGLMKSMVVETKYYKSKNNLPWAIVVPTEIPYPKTKVDFLQAYKKFGIWAESNGSEFENWYEDLSGYRDTTKLYSNP